MDWTGVDQAANPVDSEERVANLGVEASVGLQNRCLADSLAAKPL